MVYIYHADFKRSQLSVRKSKTKYVWLGNMSVISFEYMHFVWPLPCVYTRANFECDQIRNWSARVMFKGGYAKFESSCLHSLLCLTLQVLLCLNEHTSLHRPAWFLFLCNSETEVNKSVDKLNIYVIGDGGGGGVICSRNRVPVIFVSKDVCTYLVLSEKFWFTYIRLLIDLELFLNVLLVLVYMQYTYSIVTWLLVST